MHRLILSFVIVIGVLLAFNVAVHGLLALALLLLFVTGAFSYLLRGKSPKDFWLFLAELVFGPCIVLYLVKLLLEQLRFVFGSGVSSTTMLLAMLVLMTASFLYVRARLAAQKNSKEQLHINERRPIFPADEETEGEMVRDARD